MPPIDSRIHPLPPDVVAKIKSSTAITHLNGVIVELVKNALDAHARTLYVTVDFLRGGCVVEDDGDGIPPSEFELGGGLAKAHHTSKSHSNHDVLSRRGLFLASLSALSLLTITSHHLHHPSTNTVTFHHSTPVARLMPAPVYQELRFSAHGTSVTVNDLFGNMPVRVKSRAVALQRPDELERQWGELRQLLVSLMIANDQMAKLVVSVGRERRLTVCPRTRGRVSSDELDLHRISSILAQAGLADHQNTSSWDAVSANVSDFSIHAALSLTPCPTKKVQFVSMGPDPVFSRSNANLIYSEVNRLFALSDFGTAGGFSTLAGSGMPFKDDYGHGLQAISTSKAVNKWPMFYIRINTQDPRGIDGDAQDLPESERSLQRIIDVLSAMINEFLRQGGLRPRSRKRKREAPKISKPNTSSHSSMTGRSSNTKNHLSSTEDVFRGKLKLPSLRRPSNVSHHFGNWSRIKSAKNDPFTKRSPLRAAEPKLTVPSEIAPVTPVKTSPLQQSEPMSGVRHTKGSPTEHPDLLPQDADQSIATDNQDATQADTMVPWVDPYTGRSHMVNSRTGQSMLLEPSAVSALERPHSTGALLGPTMAANGVKRPRSAASGKSQNEWVENILNNWKNPIFERPEKPIGIIDISAGHDAAGRPGSSSNDRSGELFGVDSLGVSKFKGKLQKQGLRDAKIIAQVDQKFILAKMRAVSSSPGDPGSSLVLIDQHAADERCRVEALLAGLFASSGDPGRIQTINLEPIIFEIPTPEASLFGQYKKFFAFWGIEYTVEQGPKDVNAFIFVRTLPALIAERCRTEAGLVTDLIRGEIWRREEENGQGRSVDLDDRVDPDKNGWVERLDGCPRGIIDLLNSRACRTAIMFNDALGVDECQSLVGRVADCVFPFQCAHGRPSMIPILDMGGALDQDPSSEYDEYDGPGFIDAFKSWQDTQVD
ncbi:DNA mismatch repair protein [Aspergillus heteromorphus CBS 117.55]|uniref:DNA mismatch repair protein n=1 Tax=Aspergillus heteromorphus CBS 117.55 TaxID=1448321 RepID=A0A317WLR9_9EURO|nr:DNA mismatch repair protein [Aspergillus heteromorphus CBS 117.55]PWY86262.1 DNA mismatch repair protein [Aspergillus heteromorphus CBS 117.55]